MHTMTFVGRRLGNALVMASLAVVALGASAACSDPPPAPQPPPAPTPEPPPVPPPPAPKCEALKEQCKATAETRARIPGTGYTFTPPEGWIYAQLEEATVAQVGERGAVLLLTTFAPESNPAQLSKQRSDLVTSLSELVTLVPKTPVVLLKPNQETDLAGLRMSLWERKDAQRAGDTGGLLILSATVDGRELFGVGFAPSSDKEGTTAILRALGTLKRDGAGAPAASEGPNTEGSKAEGKSQ
jgi:hypothetical protein